MEERGILKEVREKQREVAEGRLGALTMENWKME